MGTRAIITINEKPYVATHWDGYYSVLGKSLEQVSTKQEIIKAASDRSIDFADLKDPLFRDIVKERVKDICERHKITEKEMKAGKRRGMIITNADYQITSIKNYGDWAEYQYDFTGGKWRVRSVSGAWDKNPAFGKWFDMPLSKEQVDEM